MRLVFEFVRVEFDTKLQDLEIDEARVSEMQNAIKHQINVRYDEAPVQHGSRRERLEKFIEEYGKGRLSERETIEELRSLMDEIRSLTEARVAPEGGLTLWAVV